jgi:translation initiation factor 3 subunit F
MNEFFRADGRMAPRIRVSPVVVFSILDHYVRRNENQESVIGALMGSRAPDGSMEIRACVPVIHTEGDEHLAIDIEFQRVMKELFQKVDNRNFMIGWYSTSYTENSQSLHEYYAKNVPNPIYMLVDPTLKNGSLNVKTLVGSTLTLGDHALKGLFREVPFEWKVQGASKIALAMMMQQGMGREAPEEEEEEDEMQPAKPWETLQVTMARLHSNLAKGHSYVTKILNGEVKEDKSIGRALSAVISQAPLVSPQAFDKVFNDSLQDMLMVVYLSKLTRAQLALHEKLYSAFTPTFA